MREEQRAGPLGRRPGAPSANIQYTILNEFSGQANSVLLVPYPPLVRLACRERFRRPHSSVPLNNKIVKPRYPEAPLGTLPADFEPLASLGEVPWLPWVRGFYLGVAMLSGFAALAAILILLSKTMPGIERQVYGFAVVLPAFLVGCAVGFWLNRRLSVRYSRQLESIDRLAIHAGSGEATYVGVAYCEGAWSYRGQTSWDRGFLTCDGAELAFVGRTGSFVLPANLIAGVRLEATRALHPEPEAKVFVDWPGTRGQANHVSFQPLGVTGSDPRGDAAMALAVSIEATRTFPATPPAATDRLPPASSEIDFPFTGNHCQSLWSDRLPMYLTITAVVAAGVVLETWLEGYFERRHFESGPNHWIIMTLTLALILWISNSMVFARVRRRRAHASRPT